MLYGQTGSAAVTKLNDPDNDTALNWQEWIAGTDPTNKSSVLAIANISGSTNGGAPRAFQSVPGKVYRIWTATAVMSNCCGPASYATNRGGVQQGASITAAQESVTIYVTGFAATRLLPHQREVGDLCRDGPISPHPKSRGGLADARRLLRHAPFGSISVAAVLQAFVVAALLRETGERPLGETTRRNRCYKRWRIGIMIRASACMQGGAPRRWKSSPPRSLPAGNIHIDISA